MGRDLPQLARRGRARVARARAFTLQARGTLHKLIVFVSGNSCDLVCVRVVWVVAVTVDVATGVVPTLSPMREP